MKTMKTITMIIALLLPLQAWAGDMALERYHYRTPSSADEDRQVTMTMAAMTILDTIQTSGQDREINPLFYGMKMGVARAVGMGLVGYAIFDTVSYLLGDRPKIRRILQESVLYTEAMNVQANSQLSTGEVRTRNTLIFFLRVPL